MDLASPVLLLQLALCAYGVGVLGSLVAMRRERIASLIAFSSATAAAVCGIGSALLTLILDPPSRAAAFELWPTPFPAIRLAVKLDPLSAFFVLIVSVLALALSVYSFGYARGYLRPQERRRARRPLQRAIAGDHAGVYRRQRVLLPHRLGDYGAHGLLPGQLRA